MTHQAAHSPFNALIVANNAVESADLREFLELNSFGPVAEAMAVDEAVLLVQQSACSPAVIVCAVASRADHAEFLAMVASIDAAFIWIDMDPVTSSRNRSISIRRPYSDIDLRAAVSDLRVPQITAAPASVTGPE